MAPLLAKAPSAGQAVMTSFCCREMQRTSQIDTGTQSDLGPCETACAIASSLRCHFPAEARPHRFGHDGQTEQHSSAWVIGGVTEAQSAHCEHWLQLRDARLMVGKRAVDTATIFCTLKPRWGTCRSASYVEVLIF